MELVIKNGDLVKTKNFVYRTLKMKAGIQLAHKQRLVNLLEEYIKKLSCEETVLLESLAEKDGNGKAIKIEKNGLELYDIKSKNRKQIIDDRKRLYDEEIVLEGKKHLMMLLTLKNAIKGFEDELAGEDAEVFANLYEQLVGLEMEGEV